jgi:hypothetical protein
MFLSKLFGFVNWHVITKDLCYITTEKNYHNLISGIFNKSLKKICLPRELLVKVWLSSEFYLISIQKSKLIYKGLF